MCSMLMRAESLSPHSGLRTWHLLPCQSHFMEWATPQEHSSAWSQRGTSLPLRYSFSQSCCAASRGMQKPHSGSPCRSIRSSCTHPFPSFYPTPGSWPCRVPTILALPGYLQNAVLGDSLISQGAAFLRFPFLHNAHSLVESTWAISGVSARSITLLGFLLSHHEPRPSFGTGSLLKQ